MTKFNSGENRVRWVLPAAVLGALFVGLTIGGVALAATISNKDAQLESLHSDLSQSESDGAETRLALQASR